MHKIFIGAILLGLFFSFSCFAAKSENVLVVGTNAEFPPFTFIENNEIVGFDIDIAKEVAQRLGKEIQFKDLSFDSLIPDLILGRVDFVAAGMSYTEERAQRVCFSKPYVTNDPLMVLTLSSKKTDGPMNLEQLKERFAGKTILVNEGFTADTTLTPLKGFKLVRLSTSSDAFMALKSGRADAFVTAKSTIDTFLATQKSHEFHADFLENTADDCALVVSKKHPEILEKIQHALDEMEEDGTIARFKIKWKLQ